MFYAHRTESSDKSEWQKLTDQLKGVGGGAAESVAYFWGREWGGIAGLLHDAGKFSTKFQRRLNRTPIAVDHATAGAQDITEAWKGTNSSRILAYVIAGHHAGLTDFGFDSGDDRSLSRLLVKVIEHYKESLEQHMPSATSQLVQPPLKPGIHPGLQFFSKNKKMGNHNINVNYRVTIDTTMLLKGKDYIR
jgi:CRISPR-associated endonuclease Cas3-HD